MTPTNAKTNTLIKDLNYLNLLSQSTHLRVDLASGKLAKSNILRNLVEKAASGLLGLPDTTSEQLLASKIYPILDKRRALLKPENSETIKRLCRHAGIIGKGKYDPDSIQQKLADLIDQNCKDVTKPSARLTSRQRQNRVSREKLAISNLAKLFLGTAALGTLAYALSKSPEAEVTGSGVPTNTNLDPVNSESASATLNSAVLNKRQFAAPFQIHHTCPLFEHISWTYPPKPNVADTTLNSLGKPEDNNILQADKPSVELLNTFVHIPVFIKFDDPETSPPPILTPVIDETTAPPAIYRILLKEKAAFKEEVSFVKAVDMPVEKSFTDTLDKDTHSFNFSPASTEKPLRPTMPFIHTTTPAFDTTLPAFDKTIPAFNFAMQVHSYAKTAILAVCSLLGIGFMGVVVNNLTNHRVKNDNDDGNPVLNREPASNNAVCMPFQKKDLLNDKALFKKIIKGLIEKTELHTKIGKNNKGVKKNNLYKALKEAVTSAHENDRKLTPNQISSKVGKRSSKKNNDKNMNGLSNVFINNPKMRDKILSTLNDDVLPGSHLDLSALSNFVDNNEGANNSDAFSETRLESINGIIESLNEEDFDILPLNALNELYALADMFSLVDNKSPNRKDSSRIIQERTNFSPKSKTPSKSRVSSRAESKENLSVKKKLDFDNVASCTSDFVTFEEQETINSLSLDDIYEWTKKGDLDSNPEIVLQLLNAELQSGNNDSTVIGNVLKEYFERCLSIDDEIHEIVAHEIFASNTMDFKVSCSLLVNKMGTSKTALNILSDQHSNLIYMLDHEEHNRTESNPVFFSLVLLQEFLPYTQDKNCKLIFDSIVMELGKRLAVSKRDPLFGDYTKKIWAENNFRATFDIEIINRIELAKIGIEDKISRPEQILNSSKIIKLLLKMEDLSAHHKKAKLLIDMLRKSILQGNLDGSQDLIGSLLKEEFLSKNYHYDGIKDILNEYFERCLTLNDVKYQDIAYKIFEYRGLDSDFSRLMALKCIGNPNPLSQKIIKDMDELLIDWINNEGDYGPELKENADVMRLSLEFLYFCVQEPQDDACNYFVDNFTKKLEKRLGDAFFWGGILDSGYIAKILEIITTARDRIAVEVDDEGHGCIDMGHGNLSMITS